MRLLDDPSLGLLRLFLFPSASLSVNFVLGCRDLLLSLLDFLLYAGVLLVDVLLAYPLEFRSGGHSLWRVDGIHAQELLGQVKGLQVALRVGPAPVIFVVRAILLSLLLEEKLLIGFVLWTLVLLTKYFISVFGLTQALS